MVAVAALKAVFFSATQTLCYLKSLFYLLSYIYSEKRVLISEKRVLISEKRVLISEKRVLIS